MDIKLTIPMPPRCSNKKNNVKGKEESKIKSTYMGTKGYTILKNTLTEKEIVKIKKDLTIKPFNGIISYQHDSSNTYPVFRESSNKMYVPRYYGNESFGEPNENKLPYGDLINVEFNGELRDNQKIVVKRYLDFVNGNSNNTKGEKTGGGLLELPCAYGKTTLSLYILSKLKVKTLVVVHKEFLLNQWIERIHQFLPTARIGKIQGKIIDIENKDIVMCMLQSISMKDYSADIFSSFGLTVIDEVHHISSETFSKSLFKLVTNYTLGLSATMNRQDGTSKVFKMFLGDVVYKGKRDIEHDVIVRAMKYYVNDDDFNEVLYDARGNPKYSTMISKLCAYTRRSEYIIKIIDDLLKENNDQQIMVLAHNKSLLTYIYDTISSRNIAPVGYYIGGMKEAALKISETKQIVIATYSMAAEALDIKTLTTLVMATPKTNIEQSVGRILRSKHSNPIVVDIIDTHSIFSNQWNKRKKFYKSQKYKIIYNSNKDTVVDGVIKWSDKDIKVNSTLIDDSNKINIDMFNIFCDGTKHDNDNYEEI
jgi:superfamily II DNA or RNA helicase